MGELASVDCGNSAAVRPEMVFECTVLGFSEHSPLILSVPGPLLSVAAQAVTDVLLALVLVYLHFAIRASIASLMQTVAYSENRGPLVGNVSIAKSRPRLPS